MKCMITEELEGNKPAINKNYTKIPNNLEENNPPNIISLNSEDIDENADITTVIYDADATDPDDDTLTYSVSGTDASYVEIDSDDGEVRLLNPADYETKDSYTFDVTASDGELSDTSTVTVNVTDTNEVSNITSLETGSVEENAEITTVIYDA